MQRQLARRRRRSGAARSQLGRLDAACAPEKLSVASTERQRTAQSPSKSVPRQGAGGLTQGGGGPQRQGHPHAVFEQRAAEGEHGDGRIRGLVQRKVLEIVGHALPGHERVQSLQGRGRRRRVAASLCGRGCGTGAGAAALPGCAWGLRLGATHPEVAQPHFAQGARRQDSLVQQNLQTDRRAGSSAAPLIRQAGSGAGTTAAAAQTLAAINSSQGTGRSGGLASSAGWVVGGLAPATQACIQHPTVLLAPTAGWRPLMSLREAPPACWQPAAAGRR